MNSKLLNFLIFFYLTNGVYTIGDRLSQKPNNGDDIVTKIIGGQDVHSIKEVPWQAAIRTSYLDPDFLCGATIIHHEWVVTSALCLNDFT